MFTQLWRLFLLIRFIYWSERQNEGDRGDTVLFHPLAHSQMAAMAGTVKAESETWGSILVCLVDGRWVTRSRTSVENWKRNRAARAKTIVPMWDQCCVLCLSPLHYTLTLGLFPMLH